MDATYTANLQACLTSAGLRPLGKRDLESAADSEYLVLYASRDNLDKFVVAHPVPKLRTAEAMVKWEIYGRVQVVRLSDSVVVIDKRRNCPCH